MNWFSRPTPPKSSERARALLPRSLWVFSAASLFVTWPAAATPSPPQFSDTDDGVYGRFEGDLDLGLGLGARLGREQAQAALRLTAHYFATAGIYLLYTDSLHDGASPESLRTLSFGIDLRPMFIPRWSLDLQQGPSVLDLALDSVSLSLGVAFAQPERGQFGSERGFEASTGFGIPLLGHASGPWVELRGQAFWPDFQRWETTALALLSWHKLVLTPLMR